MKKKRIIFDVCFKLKSLTVPIRKSFSNGAGFTLIEIGVAVVIIAVGLVFSRPHILRLIIQGKETDAIISLGKISAAMEVYRILYRSYPADMNYLLSVNPTLSAPLLSSGSKAGYNFQLESDTFSRNTFAVIAEPKEQGKSGIRKFKVDQSGNMYKADAVGGSFWSPIDPGGGVDTQGQGTNQQ